MEYNNYRVDIVAAEGVQIIGWPDSIPFTSPSNMTISQNVRDLHALWNTGKAHWEKLTPAQRNKVERQIEQDERQGIATRKPRAQRSDKG
ncbi:hypothetical protein K435DRAFT_595101, partial [Dendrothele bispora CBS 962.96]